MAISSRVKKAQDRKKKFEKTRKRLNQGQTHSEAPISMGFKSEFQAPQMSSRGQNTLVRHREYIADVPSSVLFAVLSTYSINPGLALSFPWLSQVAQRFEKYRFRFLRYTFETIAPTTSVGSVMLVPDFDAEDAAPSTKAQALSYKSSVRSQVWERIALDVKKEDLSAVPQYYIRAGPLTGSYDIKTYDVGNLFICSSGSANSNVIGELWVEYDVELLAPTIQPDSLFSPLGAYVQPLSFSGSSNAQLFGATQTIKNNGINFTIDPSGTFVTFTTYFKGILLVYIVGSTAVNDATTFGSALTVIDNQVINVTSSTYMGNFFVTASAGQTFGLVDMIVDSSNPVLTKVYFCPYSN